MLEPARRALCRVHKLRLFSFEIWHLRADDSTPRLSCVNEILMPLEGVFSVEEIRHQRLVLVEDMAVYGKLRLTQYASYTGLGLYCSPGSV